MRCQVPFPFQLLLHAALRPLLLLLALSSRSSYYFHNHFLVHFTPLTEASCCEWSFCFQASLDTNSTELFHQLKTAWASLPARGFGACQVPRAMLSHAAPWAMPLLSGLIYDKQKLMEHRGKRRGELAPLTDSFR